MAPLVPLPTLLSQALVAFTIEFDNEAEHRMAHRTTATKGTGPSGAPWLGSQFIWANVMQYITDEGVAVRDLEARARTTRLLLAGLQRWRYVTLQPDPADTRANPPTGDLILKPTAGGRTAQDIWRPLAGEIEQRWKARFGPKRISELRQSLHAVIAQFDTALPHYLPVVSPTQNGKADLPAPRRPEDEPLGESELAALDLSVLLTWVLLMFTFNFERQSKISLPISANTLRVLSPTVDVRLRDLPVLTGISKEANAMCVGFLQRHGCAVVVPDVTSGRGKSVRLTVKGGRALEKYSRILERTEQEWRATYGAGAVDNLRRALEPMVVGRSPELPSPLFEGIGPYPDGWRAKVRTPTTLPHYPMVLHRGGYPDGS